MSCSVVCGVLARCRYRFLVLLNLNTILTIFVVVLVAGTAVRGVDFVGNVDLTAEVVRLDSMELSCSRTILSASVCFCVLLFAFVQP